MHTRKMWINLSELIFIQGDKLFTWLIANFWSLGLNLYTAQSSLQDQETLQCQLTNARKFKTIKKRFEQETHNHSGGFVLPPHEPSKSSLQLPSKKHNQTTWLCSEQFLKFSDNIQPHAIKRLSTLIWPCLHKVVVCAVYLLGITYYQYRSALGLKLPTSFSLWAVNVDRLVIPQYNCSNNSCNG